MAIYAVQGLYAAGCLTMAYILCRQGLNLSFFSNPPRILTDEIKEFADAQAKEMGLKKEVVVIEGGQYRASGNTWFPGKVSIKAPESTDDKVSESEEVDSSCDWYAQFRITHDFAHIKANDFLIAPVATLAASLFTTFVLTVNYDLFTRYLGGLGVALITYRFSYRRSEKNADLIAMQHCSKEVNQAYLDMLQEAKNNGYKPSLRNWIFEPSLDEKIGYFQAHLDSQKDSD